MVTFDGQQGERLLTVSEAAAYLNVSKVTIRRWTNDGTLPCLRIGARKERRFVESELRRLLQAPDVEENHPPGSKTTGGAHRCLVCDDSAHEWDAIADAIRDHVSGHAAIVVIGDTARRDRLSAVLADQGIDTETLASSGVLRLLSVEESYLLSGSFSADSAIAFVESAILDARARGFGRLLFIGYVDWVFSGESTDEEIPIKEVMEYEERLNTIVERYPNATILCPYALPRIDSKILVDALLHHPELQFRSHVVDGLYSASPENRAR